MGLDKETLATTQHIISEVEAEGEKAVRRYAERFGELGAGAALLVDNAELRRHYDALSTSNRELLERVAERIRRFAAFQRRGLCDGELALGYGRAGQRWAPMERAACYAPGGRYPLPSSVLMTAVTARVAGVQDVIVASPKPTPMTLAAAYVAGADTLIRVGGAHAVAALAFGAGPIPAVDIIVGPGSRWVTAAKKLVAGRVAIDMIAGPSELVVLADESADAATIAADLLAQAEHDDDAIPALVTPSAKLAERVDDELRIQLDALPSPMTAQRALGNGFCVMVHSIDEGAAVCDSIAPEHLQLMCRDAERLATRLNHYGGLFVGEDSAEVFGDYGAGPNHVLPTGGTARMTGGLSVLNFLRLRSWLAIDDAHALREDCAALARLEGLEAHARAAERRDP